MRRFEFTYKIPWCKLQGSCANSSHKSKASHRANEMLSSQQTIPCVYKKHKWRICFQAKIFFLAGLRFSHPYHHCNHDKKIIFFLIIKTSCWDMNGVALSLNQFHLVQHSVSGVSMKSAYILHSAKHIFKAKGRAWTKRLGWFQGVSLQLVEERFWDLQSYKHRLTNNCPILPCYSGWLPRCEIYATLASIVMIGLRPWRWISLSSWWKYPVRYDQVMSLVTNFYQILYCFL